MCDLMPEVENCFKFFPLRIGLMFVAVLAIVSGSLTLCIIEQNSGASFHNLQNVTNINKADKAVSGLGQLITSGITAMTVMFMLMGTTLLFAVINDEENYAELFVVGMIITIGVGFCLVAAICYECITNEICILSDMHFIARIIVMSIMIGYLTLWVYFLIVCNSYVLNGDD